MKLVRHDGAALRRFLAAVDGVLDRDVALVVIGGSALSLGYGVSAATTDIDTYLSNPDALAAQLAHAATITGLAIPVQDSTIAQLPEGYDRRLRRVLTELVRLTIWVLDPYDLAASKLLRGTEHDRQQLTQLHEHVVLDREILVARFHALLEDYVGDPCEPRWSLTTSSSISGARSRPSTCGHEDGGG